MSRGQAEKRCSSSRIPSIPRACAFDVDLIGILAGYRRARGRNQLGLGPALLPRRRGCRSVRPVSAREPRASGPSKANPTDRDRVSQAAAVRRFPWFRIPRARRGPPPRTAQLRGSCVSPSSPTLAGASRGFHPISSSPIENPRTLFTTSDAGDFLTSGREAFIYFWLKHADRQALPDVFLREKGRCDGIGIAAAP